MRLDRGKKHLYGINGRNIFVLDYSLNSVVTEIVDSQEALNFKTFALDNTNDMLYTLTSIPYNDETTASQYLLGYNAQNLSESFRMEIPIKRQSLEYNNTFSMECYRSIFIDSETGYAYLAFQTPSDEEMTADYYKTHNDSVYVIDIAAQSIVKSIPVGAAPRDIIKNDLTGEVYVYSIGSQIDYLQGLPFPNPHGLLTVIESNTLDINTTIDVPLVGSCASQEIALSDNNDYLYCSGNIISCADNEIIQSFEITGGWTMSSDTIYDTANNNIIMVSGANYINVFDENTGAYIHGTSTGYHPVRSAISLQENELYFPVYDPDFSLCILDVSEKSITAKYNPGYRFDHFAMDNSTNTIIFSLYEGLHRYDPKSRTLVEKNDETIPGLLADIQVDEENGKIYVLTRDYSDQYTSFLYIYDLDTFTRQEKLTLDLYNPQEMVIDGANNRIYIREHYDEASGDAKTGIGIFDIQQNVLLDKEFVESVLWRYKGCIELNERVRNFV